MSRNKKEEKICLSHFEEIKYFEFCKVLHISIYLIDHLHQDGWLIGDQNDTCPRPQLFKSYSYGVQLVTRTVEEEVTVHNKLPNFIFFKNI